MAELNTGGNEGGGKKVRSKKMNPAVDLTAMVDLAFLLITFFMLTTSLSKPQSMELTMPDKQKDKTKVNPEQEAKESKTMTVLIGKERKLKYYMGLFDSPYKGVGPTDTTYGKDGIRKVILDKIAELKAQGFVEKEGVVVLIKATEDATYKDIIDILDEMAITKVSIYAIQDMTDAEKALMQ